MTQDLHARAKELFFQARALPQERRESFLRSRCGSDTALLEEVQSLLSYDATRSIMVLPTIATDASQRSSRQRVLILGRIKRVTIRILQEIFLAKSRRRALIALALVVLVGLAFWTYNGMQRSMESIAEAELTTLLNADIKALELWIEEKKKDVRLFSSLPQIMRCVNELVALAETAGDPATQLQASDVLSSLHELLDEYDRIVGMPEKDAIVNRDGLLIAAGHEAAVGLRLDAEGIATVLPVFGGQTIFVRPVPNNAFSRSEAPDFNTPMVYMVAPVRKDEFPDSQVIAAAAFGFPADDEFSDILSIARKGRSGETYVFDGNGLMLSESRFDDELRKDGLLPNQPGSRSILRMEVRDPGARANWGRMSPVEAATRPLTKLAAFAIAAGRKGDPKDQHGVVLDPYRNYRGEYVIGAWKWLAEYDMAVATEVAVEEQYGPLRYVQVAEWTRFGMLAACVFVLVIAACWIVVLDRDLDQAEQFGQYTLEEEIGRGGMGVVYRARHALMHRPTAIKLLQPEFVSTASLARFEREVQIASGLKHPNTIEIFDFGRTSGGSFYCVMELIDGLTLEDAVRSEGPMPVDRTVAILRQIAGSLNEAHQQGFVHRDIKPSNIMLCDRGGIPDFVKVLDFGLARTSQRTQETDITQAGVIVGTPPYMAPECVTDPMTINQRSDVYSFGALAFYLLTGQLTFRATTTRELIEKVVNEDPVPPSQVVEDASIPGELDAFIFHCLARRPEDRPVALQEELTRIQG